MVIPPPKQHPTMTGYINLERFMPVEALMPKISAMSRAAAPVLEKTGHDTGEHDDGENQVPLVLGEPGQETADFIRSPGLENRLADDGHGGDDHCGAAGKRL